MKSAMSMLVLGIFIITGCGIPSPFSNPFVSNPNSPKIEIASTVKEKLLARNSANKNVLVLGELGDVDDASVAAVIAELKEANSLHPKKIVLPINSGGGSVQAGWELIKAIETSKAPVVCVVESMAASMAFATLQSCSERIVTRKSSLMAHQLSMSGEMRGQPEKWANVVRMMHAMEVALDWQCAHRLKISLEEYKKLIDSGRELWLTAEEAVAMGAADRIIDNFSKL